MMKKCAVVVLAILAILLFIYALYAAVILGGLYLLMNLFF